MSIPEILGTSWSTIGAAVIATVAIYVAVIVTTRLAGLRTFAKMSAFDFAATIATGSIIASAALTTASLAVGLVGLVVLFTVQVAIGVMRRSDALKSLIDNRPILLVEDGQLLEGNMRTARVQADDIRAKLRSHDIGRLADVRYVVLETSGDISVMSTADEIDDFVMEGVRR
ncbi:DUF421 domain-containing protein [Euzebya sp.]|uniref:DUF421 domain-containing protein n=1 Tax=Euzebya sp. TaxID=1971409 RepID=UPI0035146308